MSFELVLLVAYHPSEAEKKARHATDPELRTNPKQRLHASTYCVKREDRQSVNLCVLHSRRYVSRISPLIRLKELYACSLTHTLKEREN